MEIKGQAKFVRTAPRKIRLLADLVRGRDVEAALTELKFQTKHAALPLIKILNSVINNAVNDLKLKKSNLFIKEIRVDGGPILYRYFPRAQGRATPIRKRSTHISIVLAERVPTVKSDKAEKEKTKEKISDEIVSIKEVKESPAREKDEIKGDRRKGKGAKSGKGFVKKMFNRKSG